MNDDELEQRREGFMTAIGLLLEHAELTVRDGVLETLRSFGDGLHSELDVSSYADTAFDADLNPCPPGSHWDPETGRCVPN